MKTVHLIFKTHLDLGFTDLAATVFRKYREQYIPQVLLLAFLAGGSLLCPLSAQTRPRIDLTGTWAFYPNVGDASLDQVKTPPVTIQVPGCWQTQGFGTPGGTLPWGFARDGFGPSPGLTAASPALRHNLTARCLYVRKVPIPSDWKGKRVLLEVRRVYRYADITVNGQAVGMHEGFSTPFEVDITKAVVFGGSNEIVIGVDNRPRATKDVFGCSIYMGNWGGLGGQDTGPVTWDADDLPIYLEARTNAAVQDIFAIPHLDKSQVTLQVTIGTGDGSPLPEGVTLKANIAPWNASGEVKPAAGLGAASVPSGTATQEVEIPVSISDLHPWSCEDPFLYNVTVTLSNAKGTLDQKTIRFGMREITIKGRSLFLNGRPLYLSGFGDDSTEPLTGMIRTDKSVFLKRFKLMRSYGFNFVRYHSSVPHDGYMDAADETGMFVQPEYSLMTRTWWPAGYRLFQKEWPQMIVAFRNHPSVFDWCMGTELTPSSFPEGDADADDAKAKSVKFTVPVGSGPLQTPNDTNNGVFGTVDEFPTKSFHQLNYYRDVVVSSAGISPCSLLGNSFSNSVYKDVPSELGMKFQATAPVDVQKIRFYKPPGETGGHTGHLWSASGEKLATVAFTNETDSGWQEASLATPYSVKPGTVYVVSVNSNTTYASTSGVEGMTRQKLMSLVQDGYNQAHTLDPTRPVNATDGGEIQPYTDIDSPWNAGNGTFVTPTGKPLLCHEYGDYCCALPDFLLIPRFEGVMEPVTYEQARKTVTDGKYLDAYPRLLKSSLVMRGDAQKYYAENAKGSGANNGFAFWLGIDFPDSGEGCWDEGMLNQFWEPKPGTTEHLTDYMSSTVLLTGLAPPDRCFYTNEIKEVPLKIWNYGPSAIKGARIEWTLTDSNNKTISSGKIDDLSAERGKMVPASSVRVDLAGAATPIFLTLQADLVQDTAKIAHNSWQFYAYPRPADTVVPGVYSETGDIPGAKTLSADAPFPNDLRVLITKGLTSARHGPLIQRGNIGILLLSDQGERGDYFKNRHGGGFGGIIEDHPIFNAIPHQGMFNQGLWQVLGGGRLLNASSLPGVYSQGLVVWGVKLTAWMTAKKQLNKVFMLSDLMLDNQVHLLFSSLDETSPKPDSRYVLNQTIQYLLTGKSSSVTHPCSTADLTMLLK